MNGDAHAQLELVVWRDAYFDFDESSPEDARADYLVRTVGFVVSETEKFLSLAQELLPDEDGYRAVTHIPVRIVEHRWPLMRVGTPAILSLGAPAGDEHEPAV